MSSRRVTRTLVFMMLGGFASSLAIGDPGDLIQNVDLPVPGSGVSVAVDCDGNVYYTLSGDTNLYKMDKDGNLLDTVPIVDAATGNGLDIDEMAFQNTGGAGTIWGQLHGSNPIDVYTIDPSTGTANLAFTAVNSISLGTFRDGIAFDGTDNTIWISGDVSNTIEHYQLDGTFINQITPKDAAGNTLGLISGITVGVGDQMYLGRNGLVEIVRVKKSNGDFIDSFASPGGARDEGLECDTVNFAPKLALWSREFESPGFMSVIEVEPGTCTCGGGAGPLPRVDSAKKGSLVVFPKVEIRWDASGNVVQDTFLDLTNDYPDDVIVQLYFVNGDPPTDPVFAGDPPVLVERGHPGWNWVDCAIMLTKDQPTYWSSLTGQPGGCQPFTVLDPGDPPGRPDPDNPGGRMLRGFVYAWAVNSEGHEISWNHLKGDAVLIDYGHASAWEYNAYSFQAVSAEHGQPTDDNPGVLSLDGIEYDVCFEKLLLDFYASGSLALSGDAATVQIDTDLTLMPVSQDLRQETNGPVITKAKFDIWNQNEVRFSGTERCISCWDQTLLSKYVGPGNHFLRGNLHTDKGKARIDGIASILCDEPDAPCNAVSTGDGDFDRIGIDRIWIPGCSTDAAILGLAAKLLVFSGASSGVDYAGMNLVGQGEESATILYDIIMPPQPLELPGQSGAEPTEAIQRTDRVRMPRTK